MKGRASYCPTKESVPGIWWGSTYARFVYPICPPVPSDSYGFIGYMPYVGSGDIWADECNETGAMGRLKSILN